MMSPASRRLLTALVLLIGTASGVTSALSPDGRQSGAPMPPWWKIDRIVRELQLTPKQVEKIDGIFNETYPELKEHNLNLDAQEKTLSRLINDNASEAKVKVQIELVESVRARRSTARQIMLYRMRNVMTPEQRVKFDVEHAKWLRDADRQQKTRSGSSLKPGSKPESRPDSRGRL
jgi:Spy/CpxP family protein refolding chaperone